MKFNKLILFVFLVSILAVSCKHSQEARRPISQASGTFMKKSAERNKKLIANEEGQIDSVIKSNPKKVYLSSTKGYWYTYLSQNTTDTITPKKGDVALFDYEVADLQGNIIYSEVELKPQTYFVDKQNIMTGLREGLKLMHKNEKVTFLFPSHIAYGYHGDDKRIGINKPLICTVNLRDFMSETDFKKEVLSVNETSAEKKDIINTEKIKTTLPEKKHKDSLKN